MPTEEIQATNVVWLTAFFDIHRRLLLYFQFCDNTVIANCLCKVIQNICTKMKNRQLGKLTDDIIILQDSVHPHVAHGVQDQLNIIQWEVLRHPAYSIDYHLQFLHPVVIKESNQRSYMYFEL